MGNHLILTHGRSGSNYLSNAINLHPDLVNYGEVFGPWTPSHRIRLRMAAAGKPTAEFLDRIYESAPWFYRRQFRYALASLRRGQRPRLKSKARVRSIGIKEFTFNFVRYECFDYLAQRPAIRVIRLYRENLFKRYLSRMQMRSSGIARTERALDAVARLEVDCEHMLREIAIMKQETEQDLVMLAGLRGNPVLQLRYEDWFRGEERLIEMAKRVFEFLEVAPLPILGGQKQILRQPPSEWVANYDQCVARLRASPYAGYLENLGPAA